jgi:hypothetical protein
MRWGVLVSVPVCALLVVAGSPAGTAHAAAVAGTARGGAVAGTARGGAVAGTARGGAVARAGRGGAVAGTARGGAVARAGRARPAGPTARGYHSAALNCAGPHSVDCLDVYRPDEVGRGRYTGHDEPALLFYSHRPGSGNNDSYLLRLPKDPAPPPNQQGTGGTFSFQLHAAFWLGMALCDSQSFPEFTTTCRPGTDANIANSPDPASPHYIGRHPGTAFLELQFYPPGWVPWPAGNGCAATRWCAALNIDSLSAAPNGAVNNNECLETVGLEPVNFAFITRSGVPQAPPNPVDATPATLTPDPARDLFMDSGDVLAVRLHDTPGGLRVVVADRTSGQSGSMTASAANDFGQVLFQPGARTCRVHRYGFHPMYATSSPATRVPWAAHSYNIAFSDEIGHFEYCGAVRDFTCTAPGVTEPDHRLDLDDNGCFPASASLSAAISGCLAADSDFDGPPYLRDWPGLAVPAGTPGYHPPQPVMFTSPTFNGGERYSRAGFETDLPAIEQPEAGGGCDTVTGSGCVNPPPGALFYPIFTTSAHNLAHPGSAAFGCAWQLGGPDNPATLDTFGGTATAEYRYLIRLAYPSANASGNPAPEFRFFDFRQILPTNPC